MMSSLIDAVIMASVLPPSLGARLSAHCKRVCTNFVLLTAVTAVLLLSFSHQLVQKKTEDDILGLPLMEGGEEHREDKLRNGSRSFLSGQPNNVTLRSKKNHGNVGTAFDGGGGFTDDQDLKKAEESRAKSRTEVKTARPNVRAHARNKTASSKKGRKGRLPPGENSGAPFHSAATGLLHANDSSGSHQNVLPRYPEGKQLRVFVYDLPRKFNFGLFTRDKTGKPSDDDDVAWGREEAIPAWPWMGKRRATALQHSVEYFLAADLMRREELRHPGSVAVRVFDPSAADVFFVPFFASLVVNLFRRRQFRVQQQFFDDFITYINASEWWQRKGGRDHVICVTHPNALKSIGPSLKNAIFILVDFGRSDADVANLQKDVISPYHALVPALTEEDEKRLEQAEADAAAMSAGAQPRGEGRETLSPFERRTTLLFFQGSFARKENGRIRGKLYNLLKDEDGVHFRDAKGTRDAINETRDGMARSKFCLHLVGDTPSSCRLFDAIMRACIPIIVSDLIELPFESEIDYSKFAIFVAQEDALRPKFLISRMRNVSEGEWTEMWAQIHAVQRHFEFHIPSIPGDAVNLLWNGVRSKLSTQQLDYFRHKRLKVLDWWKLREE